MGDTCWRGARRGPLFRLCSTGISQGPRFGFTGHQYDAGTELVYANARYYQPGVGRFLSRDPFPGLLSDPNTQTPYLRTILSRGSYGVMN